MAISVGKKTGRRTVAEINITPFTDVCLVLLIIFMVSASFLGPQRGLDVKLPSPSIDAQQDKRQDRDVVLILSPNDKITIQVVTDAGATTTSRVVTFPQLIPALSQEATTYHVKSVTVKPERGVVYKSIIRAMDSVKQAGIQDLALGVQPSAAPASAAAPATPTTPATPAAPAAAASAPAAPAGPTGTGDSAAPAPQP